MQLGLNYRGGPLSVDERTGIGAGVTRAGDRAPDAPLHDGRGATVRLFDKFRGPHFTLLALGGAEPPALDPGLGDAVRTHRIATAGGEGNGALVDVDGHAHRNYGDGLVLVRPDGYVGYTGPLRGARGLGPYLDQFFG